MSVRLLLGDCRAVLPTLAEGSVHCVVTSPPYWGLRDYGTATWDGGDAACDHKAGSDYGEKSDTNRGAIRGGPFKERCGKCGARRIDQQLGLELTPEAYVENMVGVFRDVRRVLRDDAVMFVNMGDSFDDKQLVGMPWRLAFALQADGWYLRADIIWAKPNPMPESVTDRPTKAHEYVFLLSKAARYFYDADAVREATLPDARDARWGHTAVTSRNDHAHDRTQGMSQRDRAGFVHMSNPAGRNLRSVWTIPSAPFPDAHFATFPPALAARCILAGSRMGDTVLDPFAGSGTVGEVAERHGRDVILIELSPAYVELARARTAQRGLFASQDACAE